MVQKGRGQALHQTLNLNMLLVTQGHEKSISIEVFLKSYLLLSKQEREQIKYYANPDSVKETCDLLKLKYEKISDTLLRVENCDLTLVPIQSESTKTLTTSALEVALKNIKKNDILITMPSSKDQIIFEGESCSGHTDYFRKKFANASISMLFKNKWENVLLLTDHIPLSRVPTTLDANTVVEKTVLSIREYENHFWSLDKIIFSGINPHAGENGLLGNEDENISLAIKRVKHDFKQKEVIGPLAGDSLHQYKSPNYLKVFSYHDQGLVYFKGLYGFMGANITLGLPFLRVSVDHGTAFDLFGKNQANYMGSFNLMKECLNWNRYEY